jgi:hypothetical protein
MNNPAARLHLLTKKARSHGDKPPGRLWASVFELPYESDGVKPEEVRRVVESLMEFHALIVETETGVREMGFEDFYFAPFPALRSVVHGSLSNLRGNSAGLLSPVTLEHETLLLVMATEWNKKRLEPEIDHELLSEIQTEVQQLFNEISSADINSDLKQLILTLLAEIQQAIEQYRIGGAERLKRALAFIIGQASLNSDIVEHATVEKQSRAWWTRTQGLVVKLYSAVKFANDTRQTIERAVPFLRLLGSGSEIPPID